ncbi:MAG: NUDIX domain-containing protein, partial [Brachybacterium sp.]|nr:NUDIX domain-containing protein [Brachybacterium sp.]
MTLTGGVVMEGSLSLAVSTVIFALRPHPITRLPVLWVPLVRRIRQPHQGRWALPGGPLGADEGLAASAARTLAETTRLSPRYLEQLYAFGGTDRAPTTAERTVSVVYWALVRPEEA